MRCFLHNRVGTLITESEKKNADLNSDDTSNFKCGEMLLYKYKGTYKWCVYISSNTGSSANIFCKNSPKDDNYVITNISIGDVKRHPVEDFIIQTYEIDKSKLSLKDKIDDFRMGIHMMN